MAECKVCKEPYTIRGSDGEYVRPLCRCEGTKLCFCDRAANQAQLENPSNPAKVSEYHCEKHGVSGVTKSEEPKAVEKPKPKVKPREEEIVSLEAYSPKTDPQCQFMVQCLNCENVHLNADRIYNGGPLLCPKCKAEGPSRWLDDPIPEKKHGRKQNSKRGPHSSRRARSRAA